MHTARTRAAAKADKEISTTHRRLAANIAYLINIINAMRAPGILPADSWILLGAA
jgi:hypothetical protein